MNTTITGAGATGTDLLSGTAVSNAGPQGKVWCSASTDWNSYPDSTFTLFGRESGITVVPADSGFVLTDENLTHGQVIFYGRVNPNEPLSLNITSGADTAATVFSVMVKTE